jgi:hypothetical protein
MMVRIRTYVDFIAWSTLSEINKLKELANSTASGREKAREEKG